MKTYFAFVHKDPGSAYGITFPDVPGCFSAGDTYEEAMRNAPEALRLHFDVSNEMGYQVPEPRSFDELLDDSDVRSELNEAALVAIPFPGYGEGVDVSIRLNSKTLDAVDEAAARRGVSRAEFLYEAVREKIAG